MCFGTKIRSPLAALIKRQTPFDNGPEIDHGRLGLLLPPHESCSVDIRPLAKSARFQNGIRERERLAGHHFLRSDHAHLSSEVDARPGGTDLTGLYSGRVA